MPESRSVKIWKRSGAPPSSVRSGNLKGRADEGSAALPIFGHSARFLTQGKRTDKYAVRQITTRGALARPERAVLAHHLDQHAIAQATVGAAQPRQRKGVADLVEPGAVGEYPIDALDDE